jgi:hypothetical protein
LTRAQIRAPVDGEIITFEMESSDTIDNVKAKIQHKKELQILVKTITSKMPCLRPVGGFPDKSLARGGFSDKSPPHTTSPRKTSLHLCHMVRSGQPTGVLIPVVYLFGVDESKAKNSKVAHEYTELREHDEFILVWASGE